jgi:hypothetical protein
MMHALMSCLSYATMFVCPVAFTSIKVVAYSRFRLASLLWLMISGLWDLAQIAITWAMIHHANTLTKHMIPGDRLDTANLLSRAQAISVEQRFLSLIGCALTLVFLILLFRDLRSLLDKGRPVEISPAE